LIDPILGFKGESMKRAIHKVKLSSIRIDGGTQCRKNVDPHWGSGMEENRKMDIE